MAPSKLLSLAALTAALGLVPASAHALEGGVADPSFGTAGVAKLSAAPEGSREGGRAMALDAQGRILVGGEVSGTITNRTGGWAVARFNADGTPDRSFGVEGLATPFAFGNEVQAEVSAIAPVPGSTDILVAGKTLDPTRRWLFTVARYNDDGSLDMEFGPANTGFVTADVSPSSDGLEDVVVAADGTITAAGDAGADAGFVRWDSDGVLDPTFDGPGATPGNGKFVDPLTSSVVDTVRDIDVHPSGAISAVGTRFGAPATETLDWLIARYTSTGARDPGFGGGDGIVRSDFIGTNEFAGGQALMGDTLYVFGTLDSEPGGGPGEDRTYGVAAFDAQTGTEIGVAERYFELPGDQNLVAATVQHLGGSREASAERFVLAGTGVVGETAGGMLMRLRRSAANPVRLELDPDFGSGGVVITPSVGGYWGAVAVDAQNRIVAGGNVGLYEQADLAAARFLDREPRPEPQTPADTRAPGGRVVVVTRSLTKALRGRAVVLRVSIDEAGSYAVTGLGKRVTIRFAAAGSKSVRMKLGARRLRALKDRRSARVSFRFERRDLAGNVAGGRLVKMLRKRSR
jgi:uncharacterized delta-60 repeat protein